ncbi:MAG: spore cortex biosynthesis protein YabQ [Ruminococcus sp.]|nr:spore cortex biosynthesis protein YabQ [Ruminococcus sp.]
MEFTITELVSAFLHSLVVGLCLAVVYEPIRFLHKIGINKSIHYLVADIVYMLLCGLVTYFYCLTTLEGSVRFFVIIGELIGFLVFWFTVRRLLDKIYNPVIKISTFFFGNLLKFSRKIMYNIKNKVSSVFNKLRNFIYERRKGKKEKPRRRNKRSKAEKKQK